ncbi:DUF1365 domain-containing protein [Phenylobacterium immobile]|uniref:DUF1365 domain-containing protein n=1 Tax=Phenylobacterium immobile TaxID=21 RepID=UPI000AF5A5DB|nr:DUF1365 domain-containing protein [Phenylobacterium immobile]
MSVRSGLYAGVVTHVRKRPRAHRLKYRIFMLAIDLDEAAELDARLRLFSLGRFNLLSLYPRRHGDGTGTPLKAQIEGHLARAGVAGGGRIEMLAMPAVLGSAFNPLTVFFCHDVAGALTATLYEVNNTFGERHSYLIPADAEPRIDKRFYVSPFMDMDLSYAFQTTPPGDRVAVAVNVSDADGPILATAFAGERRALSDQALFRAWAGHPWMTLGVLSAIHWEALKIWLKGEKVRTRPPVPREPLTVRR